MSVEAWCVIRSVMSQARQCRYVSSEAICISACFSLSLSARQLLPSITSLVRVLLYLLSVIVSSNLILHPSTNQKLLRLFISHWLFFVKHIPVVWNNRKALVPTNVILNRLLTGKSRERRTKRTKVLHTFIMDDNSLNKSLCSFM